MTGDLNGSKRVQVSESLKCIAPQLREMVALYPSHVRHLLNDAVPNAAYEVSAVTSALQIVRFRSAVAAGLQHIDIVRLRQAMVSDLGFSETTATWVAETWMSAFGLPSKEAADHQFRCPHCLQEFASASYWKNQKLICPACNSHVLFSGELVPHLHRKGWTQKRQKGGDWKLVGVSGKPRSTLIRERLQTLLNDPTQSEEAVARELGLDEIVEAIPDEVEKALARRGKKLNDMHCSAIVRAVAHTHLGSNAYDMQAILRPSGDPALQALTCIASYSWLGHSGISTTLTFTQDNVAYSVGTRTITIPYVGLARESISCGGRRTEIRIGSDLLLDISGSGIPRKKLLEVLVLLGEIFRGLENASW